MVWHLARKVTADTTAQQGELIYVDLATAAANRVITAPASSPTLGKYFGVKVAGQANGFKVDIKTPAAVLITTLDVDNEGIWIGGDGSAWRHIAMEIQEPVFASRFSALGNWLSAGADANLTDTSGNARDLTKSVTIAPATGFGEGNLATAYPGRYSRSDATFQLAAAMSYEMLINLTNVSNGALLQYGTGASGSANNLQFMLRLQQDGNGVPRWTHRQQSGANVNSDLTGPAAPFGWQHVGVTRASNGQTAKIYVNGTLGATATLTAPDGGASGSLLWGGTVSNQALANQQFGAIYNSELTAAQMGYLAKLRLSKIRERVG